MMILKFLQLNKQSSISYQKCLFCKRLTSHHITSYHIAVSISEKITKEIISLPLHITLCVAVAYNNVN